MRDPDSPVAGYSLLIITIAFIGWNFYQELSFPNIQYSDVAFHISVLKILDKVAHAGLNTLDFWYDGVPYGFALFRAYQYIPYLLMYGIYICCGKLISLTQILIGSNLILSLALPSSIFFSLRMVGVKYLETGIAALISVLISDGSEYGMGLQNYTFGTIGIITQLWAMVFLFPAICSGFQFIFNRTYLGVALISSFMTFGCHVVAAAILLLCLSIFALAKLWITRRLPKEYFILVLLIATVTAHQWIFILIDSSYINRSMLEPSWKYEGRGFYYLTNLLWGGGLFDHNRFPIMTMLLLPSLLYNIIYNREIRSGSHCNFISYAPFLFILFFTLCSGREIWGWLFNILPVLQSLHVHRFAIAVHYFGIIIIAFGVAHIIRLFAPHYPRHLLAIFTLLALLKPAIQERATMFSLSHKRQLISADLVERDTDLKQLLYALEQVPYGWTYIGSNTSWQNELKVAGYIPLDLFTAMRGIPTVGGILFHAFSLSGETLFDFNPQNETHFELFGIRNVVAPLSWKGAKDFSLQGTYGRYALWTRNSHMIAITNNNTLSYEKLTGQTNLARSFVQQFKGYDSSVGTFTSQKMDQPWIFSGTAVMKEAGSVIGAVGYHPNWKVLIDGENQKTEWVLPGFIKADIPAGQHEITFEYKGSSIKKYLLLFSIFIILITLWLNTFPAIICSRRSNWST